MAMLTGVKLTWTDTNDFEDGFKLYRSLTPFDKDNLPAVYETLPPNTEQYVDTEVDEDTTYYYMLSTYVGGKEEFFPATVNIRIDVAPGPVGTPTEGGYVIGTITLDGSYGVDEGTYAIIAAPKAAEVSRIWKNVNTDTPNTSDKKDGLANTYAMIVANQQAPSVIVHAAANYCADYRGAGYSDWYLPSEDELYLMYANRRSLADLQISDSNYWSSTQTSASNAQVVYMFNGARFTNGKSYSYLVRPVRRIRIS